MGAAVGGSPFLLFLVWLRSVLHHRPLDASEKSRDDHYQVSKQLYHFFALGRDVARMKTMVGEKSLMEMDHRYMEFAQEFERRFIAQSRSPYSVDGVVAAQWHSPLLQSLMR